ncbi:hypothetical protein W04_0081 [Pseudoalteromonas sp. SW0106-04]|nr:hypothetical protein W04_0081 [Pseudoalteromonas sp. SW0106-04]
MLLERGFLRRDFAEPLRKCDCSAMPHHPISISLCGQIKKTGMGPAFLI